MYLRHWHLGSAEKWDMCLWDDLECLAIEISVMCLPMYEYIDVLTSSLCDAFMRTDNGQVTHSSKECEEWKQYCKYGDTLRNISTLPIQITLLNSYLGGALYNFLNDWLTEWMNKWTNEWMNEDEHCYPRIHPETARQHPTTKYLRCIKYFVVRR